MLLAVCIALFKWEVSETVQLALFFLLIEYNYNFICMDVIKMVYVWEFSCLSCCMNDGCGLPDHSFHKFFAALQEEMWR